MPCIDAGNAAPILPSPRPALARFLDPDTPTLCRLLSEAAANRARELQLVCSILAPEQVPAAAAIGSTRHLCSPIFQHWLRSTAAKLVATRDPRRCDMEARVLPNMLCSRESDAKGGLTLAGRGGWITTWDPGFALQTRSPGVRLQRDGDVWNFLLPGYPRPSLTLHMAPGPALRGTVLACDGAIVYQPGETTAGCGVVLRNDLPPLRLALHRFVFPRRELEVELDHACVRDDIYPSFDGADFWRALDTIATAWPEQHREMALLLQAIVPVSAPRGWTLNGYTISSIQGACWIGTRGHVNLVEHLVHECGHIKLRYVEESRPILTEEQTARRFQVAWRDDPRPIVGIFEGVYVGIKSILALAYARMRGVMPRIHAAEARKRERQLRDQVTQALPILASHARFAPGGREFLDWAGSALGKGASHPPSPV